MIYQLEKEFKKNNDNTSFYYKQVCKREYRGHTWYVYRVHTNKELIDRYGYYEVFKERIVPKCIYKDGWVKTDDFMVAYPTKYNFGTAYSAYTFPYNKTVDEMFNFIEEYRKKKQVS